VLKSGSCRQSDCERLKGRFKKLTTRGIWLGRQFSGESLDLMRRIKQMFDPLSRLNPGKLLPTGKGCVEMRQPPLIDLSRMM
jgi:hypothetical protein